MTSQRPDSDRIRSQPGEPTAACDIQQELRFGHKFSIADVLYQEGGSFLKGDSPVPRRLQAITAIRSFIDQNLADSSGALQATLQTWVATDEAQVCRHLDAPLVALNGIVTAIVQNQQMFYEFVRQVDVKCGEIYGERPRFQRPGQAPSPDDEYTHESVHQQLTLLLDRLKSC